MITETNGFFPNLSEGIIAVNFRICVAMSDVIKESREYTAQLSKQSLVLEMIRGKSFFQQGQIPGGQHPEEVLQVSPVTKPLILDKNGHRKTPHIGIQLFPQAPNRITVPMVNNSHRVVLNGESTGQHPVPKLGISAAARRANVKSFIKVPNLLEDLFPEGHISSGADLPNRRSAVKVGAKEPIVEYFRDVTAVEGPEFLKYHFCLGFQRSCDDQPCHRSNGRIPESLRDPVNPISIGLCIVIGIGYNRTFCGSCSCVPGHVKTRNIFTDIA